MNVTVEQCRENAARLLEEGHALYRQRKHGEADRVWRLAARWASIGRRLEWSDARKITGKEAA